MDDPFVVQRRLARREADVVCCATCLVDESLVVDVRRLEGCPRCGTVFHEITVGFEPIDLSTP